MRNGASRSPKCSRYIVIGSVALGMRASAARFARIGGAQFSTRPPRGLEAPIEGAARHAEEFGSLRHVALRDFERRVQIRLLDAFEGSVEAEGLAGEQFGARPCDRIAARGIRRRRELG